MPFSFCRSVPALNYGRCSRHDQIVDMSEMIRESEHRRRRLIELRLEVDLQISQINALGFADFQWVTFHLDV
jgi:hypothetical protein